MTINELRAALTGMGIKHSHLTRKADLEELFLGAQGEAPTPQEVTPGDEATLPGLSDEELVSKIQKISWEEGPEPGDVDSDSMIYENDNDLPPAPAPEATIHSVLFKPGMYDLLISLNMGDGFNKILNIYLSNPSLGNEKILFSTINQISYMWVNLSEHHLFKSHYTAGKVALFRYLNHLTYDSIKKKWWKKAAYHFFSEYTQLNPNNQKFCPWINPCLQVFQEFLSSPDELGMNKFLKENENT